MTISICWVFFAVAIWGAWLLRADWAVIGTGIANWAATRKAAKAKAQLAKQAQSVPTGPIGALNGMFGNLPALAEIDLAVLSLKSGLLAHPPNRVIIKESINRLIEVAKSNVTGTGGL